MGYTHQSVKGIVHCPIVFLRGVINLQPNITCVSWDCFSHISMELDKQPWLSVVIFLILYKVYQLAWVCIYETKVTLVDIHTLMTITFDIHTLKQRSALHSL